MVERVENLSSKKKRVENQGSVGLEKKNSRGRSSEEEERPLILCCVV